MRSIQDKAKKVDKKAFLDDFDKEFLMPNTFGHVKDKEERG